MTANIKSKSDNELDKIIPYIKRLKNNLNELIKENQNLELKIKNNKKLLAKKDNQLIIAKDLILGYKKSTTMLNKIIIDLQDFNVDEDISTSSEGQSIVLLRQKLQETISYYEERLEQQEKNITELFEGKESDFTLEIDKLKEKLREKDQELTKIQNLETVNSNNINEITSLKSEKASLQEKISSNEDKIAELTELNNKLSQIVNESKKDLEDSRILKDLHKDLSVENKTLKESLNTIENSFSILKKNYDELINKKTTQETELTNLKELKAKTEKKFVEERERALKETEKKYNSSIIEKQNIIKENEEKISSLDSQLHDSRIKIQHLQDELMDAQKLELVNIETLNNYVEFISERVYDVKRVLFHKLFRFFLISFLFIFELL